MKMLATRRKIDTPATDLHLVFYWKQAEEPVFDAAHIGVRGLVLQGFLVRNPDHLPVLRRMWAIEPWVRSKSCAIDSKESPFRQRSHIMFLSASV